MYKIMIYKINFFCGLESGLDHAVFDCLISYITPFVFLLIFISIY